VPQWFYDISRGGILPLLPSARQRKKWGRSVLGVQRSAFSVAAVFAAEAWKIDACIAPLQLGS